MLRRQQASAVVAARTQIVNGAVSMVELALEKLAEKHIVELDEERKAAMVSNLLVVLCSESAGLARGQRRHALPVRCDRWPNERSSCCASVPRCGRNSTAGPAQEFRSVNGQIEFLLQRAVNQRKKDKPDKEEPGHE